MTSRDFLRLLLRACCHCYFAACCLLLLLLLLLPAACCCLLLSVVCCIRASEAGRIALARTRIFSRCRVARGRRACKNVDDKKVIDRYGHQPPAPPE
jgi:hypothetical protein